MQTLSDRLDYWVQESPDKLLFEYLDIYGKSVEKYTFAEFDKASRIVASNLAKNHKFKKDDKILITYPPGIEMIASFMACVRLGLIPVPTYPPTSSGFQSAYYKMEHIAKDCGAAAVLTNGEYYWSLKLNMDRNNIVEETVLSKLPWINTSEFTRESDLKDYEQRSSFLFLQYTSGSTTDPKGVMVSHENLINNADGMLSDAPLGVSWLPQYHDMGLIGYNLFMIAKGGTTIGFSTLDFIRKPSLWLETITKYKATHTSAPNFAYDYVVDKISSESLANIDLSSLKMLMTAAEPVRAATYHSFVEKFSNHGLKGGVHYAAYGLAENTLAVSKSGTTSISVLTNALKQHRLKVYDGADGDTTQIMSCGKPIKDQIVKIVDPNSCLELEEDKVGEVWLAGPSKCLGYWGKPELTRENFEARIASENGSATHTFLRTGDLGFMYEGELYICGRAKDMIIIRGANYYPQDIEQIVEGSTKKIRDGYVAAFANEENGEEKLVIVAGIKNKNKIPDHNEISNLIREKLNIIPSTITFTTTKSIPKTSSGKIMRQKTKQLWADGELEVIENHTLAEESDECSGTKSTSAGTPFGDLMAKYGFKGDETYSLVHVLDSLDLAVLIHDVKELIKDNGAAKLSSEIDARLLQEISISEFFDLMQQFNTSSILAINRLKKTILKLQKEHNAFEQKRMLQDAKLTFKPDSPEYDPEHLKSGKILLTGGTGFLGPFILKSLLEQTDETIYVLVRADNDEKGLERLKEAFDLSNIPKSEYLVEFEKRVVAVCGDLAKPMLGLNEKTWDFLASNIHTIYNNGALVNYLFNYEKMRSANVSGTNEIIKLALDGNPSILNHVSTTFIFGWAVKDTLFETDTCNSLDLLDFGYSQTKWVSEQIVLDAMEQGLNARIFRPALITPSVYGGGNNFDISIRLIAFMINHGITVNSFNQVSFTPVDVVASNFVAISGLPESVNKTFHVTRDEYARMKDITDIITKLTGKEFKGYELPKFVPQIVDKCRKEDLLFPLLDFLVRSVDNISSMEFKLYSNETFCNSRAESSYGVPDPTLEETVKGMLKFMISKEIIDVKLLDSESEVEVL